MAAGAGEPVSAPEAFPELGHMLLRPRGLQRRRCHDDRAHASCPGVLPGGRGRGVLRETARPPERRSRLGGTPCGYARGPWGLAGRSVTAHAAEAPWSPCLGPDHAPLPPGVTHAVGGLQATPQGDVFQV